MLPVFPLLIKPAGAACNLRCRYCFYLEKQNLSPASTGFMSKDLLERMTRSYLALPMPRYLFIWQGGEPLLMGPDFFREAMALQKRHARGGMVENFVQTNGTLITREWAELFQRENVLVGVSLDGPAEVHDRYRLDTSGKGSHARVLAGIAALLEAGCAVNILTLVNSANVRNAAGIFRYLCDLGHRYHQYIPCVEFDRSGAPQPFALTPEQWGVFLIELYEAWISRPYLDASIRYFDSLLHRLVFGAPQLCHTGQDCRQYLVVERNGDLYPCDFFVDRSFLLGRAGETPWKQVLESASFCRFGALKKRWAKPCRACDYFALCGGDCLKHRVRKGKFSPDQKSWLCQGYKAFFDHALPGFETISCRLRTHGAPVPSSILRPACG